MARKVDVGGYLTSNLKSENELQEGDLFDRTLKEKQRDLSLTE